MNNFTRAYFPLMWLLVVITSSCLRQRQAPPAPSIDAQIDQAASVSGPILGGANCDIDVRPNSDRCVMVLSYSMQPDTTSLHIAPGAGHGQPLRTLVFATPAGEVHRLDYDWFTSETTWRYRPFTLRLKRDDDAVRVDVFVRERAGRTHIARTKLPLIPETKPTGVSVLQVVHDPAVCGDSLHQLAVWFSDNEVLKFGLLESE